MDGTSRQRRFNSCTFALDTIEDVDLDGKTFAITGTTSGIGIETARCLALRGAHVVMLNRNIVLSEKLKQEIMEEKPDAKIDIIVCDLSSLQSTKSAADQYLEKGWPLHGLILNAGVFGPAIKMTIDNFETNFQIHHLAHFLIVRQLLPVLRQSAPSRIVVVSSNLSGFTGLKKNMSIENKIKKLCPKDASEYFFKLYAYSKMCNVLMAFKLHRDEFEENKISVYAVHPGKVSTNIFRDYGAIAKIFGVLTKPFSKNLSQGASTQVFCAAHPEIAEVSGKFWSDCWDDEKQLHGAIARDEELQDELWKYTEGILNEWIDEQNS